MCRVHVRPFVLYTKTRYSWIEITSEERDLDLQNVREKWTRAGDCGAQKVDEHEILSRYHRANVSSGKKGKNINITPSKVRIPSKVRGKTEKGGEKCKAGYYTYRRSYRRYSSPTVLMTRLYFVRSSSDKNNFAETNNRFNILFSNSFALPPPLRAGREPLG